MQKLVLHIDMDAFYASVEQRDNPQIADKPVIVGGLSSRGVVSTASYQARVFGVHSAMPMATAKKLCPHGIYLKPRHDHYHQVSQEIMAILKNYSPTIEPLSIDEAFLDLSGMHLIVEDFTAWAKKLKAEIQAKTQLTASVGIAPNKFLAKLASDFQKPDGLTIITPKQVDKILEPLSVKYLFGIGKTTQKALQTYGINTIGDLKKTNYKILEKVLGQQTEHFLQLAHGIDHRPVVSEQQAKSIGRETTFIQNVTSKAEGEKNLLILAQQVGWRLRSANFCGHTLTIKIRFGSFETITRSQSSSYYFYNDEDIYKEALKLAQKVSWFKGVRLIGISISKLVPLDNRLETLHFDDQKERLEKQTVAIDNLKKKFGENIIYRAASKKATD